MCCNIGGPRRCGGESRKLHQRAAGAGFRSRREAALMAGEPGWVPPEVDTRRANAARVYDYLLGGSHNFLADQDVGRTIVAVEPNSRAIGRANRAFLGRAVRFLAAAGIRQFLDIGSGIPTEGNVHEVARQAAPGSRVVYVDVDPVAVAHSKAMLSGMKDAATIEADLRDPGKILAHPTTCDLIDFTRPAGLLLVAVLHFIADADDPWRIVSTLRDALAPGSYLVLCHGTDEGKRAVAQAAEKVYQRSVSTALHMRQRAEILRFFDGFEILEPGLVPIPLWRPDAPDQVAGDQGRFWGGLVGVARKPHRPDPGTGR
jgi:SAM-dependent methyltransferase